MSSKKTETFFEKVEAAGLSEAFGKLTTIASETVGIYLEDMVDDMVSEMESPVCRVRYEKKETGEEAYIFETRRAEEEEYHFAVLYAMQNDMISYRALTQVREYLKMGYEVCFG